MKNLEDLEDIEDLISPSLSALKNRYLLTRVGDQQVAFPSQWVAEILLVESAQILALPFYRPSLLGIVHHRGLIVPLILAHLLFPEAYSETQPAVLAEKLSVIRLGQSAQHLSGVGIVVEHVVDQYQLDSNPSEHEDSGFDPASVDVHKTPSILFQLTDIPDRIWQPL